MKRVFNFSAGPSTLPQSVLEKAASELVSFGESGMSVMEMSHRSRDYIEIITETEESLRSLMNIPDNYKVLFLQGGATMQFAMVPINLMKNKTADYIVSGMFSGKAAKEAAKYGKINIIASSKEDNFKYVPKVSKGDISPDADYLHICHNNTIFGTKFNYIPDCGDIPLVADMSSSILSEPIDVSKYGLIYAGAQKNMGPAGLTVVIIREDLLTLAPDFTPDMLNYKLLSDNDSMLNTPPTYSIYMCGLVLKWIRDEIGGLDKMCELNEEKASLLYSALDESKLFRTVAKKEDRSMMNVTFTTKDDKLDDSFIAFCKSRGLVNIKGHRSVGGMRASIYNAMPKEGILHLIESIKIFESENI